MRWYVRWKSGLDLEDSQKVLYATEGFGTLLHTYFDLGDNPNAIRIVVGGTPYKVQGWGWYEMNGNSNTSDEKWHCFEVHFKNNPGGGADIAEWWIDGVKRLSFSNLSYQADMAGFGLPSNQRVDNLSGDFFNDVDDVVIQTTGPIGCLSGGPAAPKNLKVQ